MNILTERIELDNERGWGYVEALCSLSTAEYCEKRRAMLVIPGGGYSFTSEREAEPVARKFYAEGYNTFTLYYSTTKRGSDVEGITDKKTGLPKPLLEASRAIAHIRKNADKYNIDPEKIAIVGFSAGGHLAATLATMWHMDFVCEAAGIKKGENKPNAAILSYPVISSDPSIAHMGSFDNLLSGSKNIASDKALYSAENRVTNDTCPCFLWHTVTDTCVPVENSIVMAKALAAEKISFEMHIYPEGPHGYSTAEPDVLRGEKTKASVHASSWVSCAVKWLEYIFS